MGAEPTVYVIDDDKLSRMSICALVKSMGVNAEPFPSAEEFLSAYEHDQAGCLVTDVRMLGMSGLELQERLAERDIDLPVILITAYANTSLTVRAIQKGAVTLLEKPFNDQDLWDAVRQALAQNVEARLKRSEKEQILQRLESLTDDEHQVFRPGCGYKLQGKQKTPRQRCALVSFFCSSKVA